MKEITRINRDWIFLMQGIVVGAILGLCGNLVVTFFYDAYRNETWMPWIVGLSLGILIGILGNAIYDIKKLTKEVGAQPIEKKEEE